MSNKRSRFEFLNRSDVNELVDITSNNGDGTSSGTTLGGNPVVVYGESVPAGGRALVVNGEIVRSMPSGPAVVVEV